MAFYLVYIPSVIFPHIIPWQTFTQTCWMGLPTAVNMCVPAFHAIRGLVSDSVPVLTFWLCQFGSMCSELDHWPLLSRPGDRQVPSQHSTHSQTLGSLQGAQYQSPGLFNHQCDNSGEHLTLPRYRHPLLVCGPLSADTYVDRDVDGITGIVPRPLGSAGNQWYEDQGFTSAGHHMESVLYINDHIITVLI